MIKVKEAIIVEGKYDKIKLSSIIDGLIITTNGFGIFNDKERQYLIRELAKKRGIIVLTDSDSAGFVIRNFLKGSVPKEQIKHAYIPDIFGKEKRKDILDTILDRMTKEGFIECVSDMNGTWKVLSSWDYLTKMIHSINIKNEDEISQ